MSRAGTGHRRRAPRHRLVVALLGVLVVLFGAAFAVAHWAVQGGGDAASPGHRALRPPGSTGGSTPPATTAPASTTTNAAVPDPLGPAAASYLSGRQGDVTAAVEDLSTGARWVLGATDPQAEGSIVKVDILAALLHQREASGGGLDPSEEGLAQAMIEESDNDAATTLWDATGAPGGLATFNASVGLTGTTPSSCVECPNFPWPGWGLTTTTPTDQLTLLKTLVAPSPLLSGSDQAYALGLMEHVDPSEAWGVSGGVPEGVTVALKNGWLPLNDSDTDWQINSIGWVDGMGRNYLVAVLSTNNPSEQYGIDTIDGLSGLIWQALGAG